MNKPKVGKLLLTFALAATSIVSTVVDMNDSHLFNPAWHPHAVFHDALMLLFLAGMAVVGIWLLWRRSPEPRLGPKVAALIVTLFWTPFFYTTFILETSSLDAFQDGRFPVIAGVTVQPNVIIATLFLALTWVGHALARQAPPSPDQPVATTTR